MKRCCIFLHSGEFDRAYQAFSITNVLLAMGGEVHIFLSYGGLRRFVKGNLDRVVIDSKEPPFREEFERHLEKGTIDPISEMVDTAKRFGNLKIYACTASMAVLNISRDELLDVVDSSMGLVSFLNIVKDAYLVLYI